MSRTAVPVDGFRTVTIPDDHLILTNEDTGEPLLDDDTGLPLRWWSAYIQPRRVEEVPVGNVATTTGETGRVFAFRLTDDDGTTPDLTGLTIVARLARSATATVKEDVTTVTGQPDGIVLLTVPADVPAGVWLVEFQVDGGKFTASTFPDPSQLLPTLMIRNPLGGS